jgi:hypothetical protein
VDQLAARFGAPLARTPSSSTGTVSRSSKATTASDSLSPTAARRRVRSSSAPTGCVPSSEP